MMQTTPIQIKIALATTIQLNIKLQFKAWATIGKATTFSWATQDINKNVSVATLILMGVC